MNPAGHSAVQSIITEAAREAVMEEAGRSVSSITNADRSGPTLLLDAVEPDALRFVKRYCEWLARGFGNDPLIAARFDRTFQRLRRIGANIQVPSGENTPPLSLDTPTHWEGPAPDLAVIETVLNAWANDYRLAEPERRILHLCVNECRARPIR